MTIDEAFLREVVARFQRHALSSHLRLAAKRDVPARALWGCAYSQCMARARDNSLGQFRIDAAQIAGVERDFRVDRGRLLGTLLGCIPAYDAMRDAVAAAVKCKSALLALSAVPGVARDGAAIAIMYAMVEALGELRHFRVLHSHELPGLNASWSGAHHHPVRRHPGRAFALELRQAIRSVQRAGPDAVGFVAIDNPVVAREVGELVAGARVAFLAADRVNHIYEAMRYAGETNRSERAGFLASVTNNQMALGSLQFTRRESADLFKSAPARSAAYLREHGTHGGSTLNCCDDVMAVAAQLTLDEIGSLSDVARARADICDVLHDKENREVLATQLIGLMQTPAGVRADNGAAVPRTKSSLSEPPG